MTLKYNNESKIVTDTLRTKSFKKTAKTLLKIDLK